MEITEVRIFLKEGQDRKLKAYATVTFDNAFVVRNVKVIEGNKGMFVAMPSRKMKEPCPKCHFRNTVKSKYCNQCGASLPQTELKPPTPGDEAHQSDHRDIAHPITSECRDYIQKKVLAAYEAEQKAPPPAAEQKAPPPAAEQKPHTPAAPAAAKPKPPASETQRVRYQSDDIDGDNDIEL